jgi:hypothetical protein
MDLKDYQAPIDSENIERLNRVIHVLRNCNQSNISEAQRNMKEAQDILQIAKDNFAPKIDPEINELIYILADDRQNLDAYLYKTVKRNEVSGVMHHITSSIRRLDLLLVLRIDK